MELLCFTRGTEQLALESAAFCGAVLMGIAMIVADQIRQHGLRKIVSWPIRMSNARYWKHWPAFE